MVNISAKRPAILFLIVALLALLYPAWPSRAEDNALPKSVSAEVGAPLVKVGQGTYRKFGFRIYDATLWAAESRWDAAKPYSLQLRYTKSLSKDLLIDTVMDDIKDQGVADEATRAHWKELLSGWLHDVAEDDELLGLNIPGKKAMLFFNGAKVATIDDPLFSQAFFNVWLGTNADPDLRKKLLGETD